MKINLNKKISLWLVKIALEKKAEKPVILELKGLVNFCEYFVILSGNSSLHVKAIYENLIEACEKEKIRIHHFEKDENFSWCLIDLFDIVVHIFLPETRSFYNLEYLWREAKKIRLPKSV